MSLIHVANYSGAAVEKWTRLNVDFEPPHAAGEVGGLRYVVGRATGLDTRAVDIRVRLEAGEIRTFDLSQSTPWLFIRGAPPENPGEVFGQLTLASRPMQLLDFEADGAGYALRLWLRTGPMLSTTLDLVWYPDQLGWAEGEVTTNASNPAVPDMVATVPADFTLRFGDSDVVIPGLGAGPLIPAGTLIGDGQGTPTLPVTLIWRRLLTTPEQWAAAAACATLALCANGIQTLYPGLGNPTMRAGTHPLNWTREHWDGAIARLHNWESGPLGSPARSENAGATADMGWPGAECAAGPRGLGSETICKLVAFGGNRRPCTHLEVNGEPILPQDHPDLILWVSRAHFVPAISPDRLGKLRGLVPELDSHSWSGYDRQHHTLANLFVALRISGSKSLQRQLATQARIYILSDTIATGLSTSHTDAARCLLWAGLLVRACWFGLEDRVLAQQVADRFRQRVELIYLPELSEQPGDIWDPRFGDPRLVVETGMPAGWMPDQQGGGALGLDLECERQGLPAGRALALRGAKAVLLRAYDRDASGRWREWPRVGYNGAAMVPLIVGTRGRPRRHVRTRMVRVRGRNGPTSRARARSSSGNLGADESRRRCWRRRQELDAAWSPAVR